MTKQPTKLQERINLSLTIVVMVLLVVLPPVLCGLLYLSRVPDVTWGGNDGEPAYTRLWMHRERRPVGLGYETRRVVIEYSDTRVCVENNLRFLLWGSSDRAEPATSFKEMILVEGQWQSTGEDC